MLWILFNAIDNHILFSIRVMDLFGSCCLAFLHVTARVSGGIMRSTSIGY